ncbi:MAG: TetR/AcrR family transcriptional regulator [Solirubrobacteraceae bacterium]|nr:TetR/AcrR family transcriptional regulator [Solirubrobacteraceae bacterium]
MPDHAAQDPPVSRQEQRRAHTRGRLLTAARELFAEQGVERTRINQITEHAGVGFGSFYNHFDDKDAIVEAVLRENSDAYGATVDELTAGVQDPAEVIAIAHRHLIAAARSDPSFAWLIVRLDVSNRLMLDVFAARALRDLQAGIDSGRFSVTDPIVTLYACGGALVGVMQGVLQGVTPEDADIAHAANMLRMLGLTPEDAAEVAARPLPSV